MDKKMNVLVVFLTVGYCVNCSLAIALNSTNNAPVINNRGDSQDKWNFSAIHPAAHATDIAETNRLLMRLTSEASLTSNDATARTCHKNTSVTQPEIKRNSGVTFDNQLDYDYHNLLGSYLHDPFKPTVKCKRCKTRYNETRDFGPFHANISGELCHKCRTTGRARKRSGSNEESSEKIRRIDRIGKRSDKNASNSKGLAAYEQGSQEKIERYITSLNFQKKRTRALKTIPNRLTKTKRSTTYNPMGRMATMDPKFADSSTYFDAFAYPAGYQSTYFPGLNPHFPTSAFGNPTFGMTPQSNMAEYQTDPITQSSGFEENDNSNNEYNLNGHVFKTVPSGVVFPDVEGYQNDQKPGPSFQAKIKNQEFTFQPKPLLNYMHFFPNTESGSKEFDRSWSVSNEYHTFTPSANDMISMLALNEKAKLNKIVHLGQPLPRNLDATTGKNYILVDKANVNLKHKPMVRFDEKHVQNMNGFKFSSEEYVNAKNTSETSSLTSSGPRELNGNPLENPMKIYYQNDKNYPRFQRNSNEIVTSRNIIIDRANTNFGMGVSRNIGEFNNYDIAAKNEFLDDSTNLQDEIEEFLQLHPTSKLVNGFGKIHQKPAIGINDFKNKNSINKSKESNYAPSDYQRTQSQTGVPASTPKIPKVVSATSTPHLAFEYPHEIISSMVLPGTINDVSHEKHVNSTVTSIKSNNNVNTNAVMNRSHSNESTKSTIEENDQLTIKLNLNDHLNQDEELIAKNINTSATNDFSDEFVTEGVEVNIDDIEPTIFAIFNDVRNPPDVQTTNLNFTTQIPKVVFESNLNDLNVHNKNETRNGQTQSILRDYLLSKKSTEDIVMPENTSKFRPDPPRYHREYSQESQNSESYEYYTYESTSIEPNFSPKNDYSPTAKPMISEHLEASKQLKQGKFEEDEVEKFLDELLNDNSTQLDTPRAIELNQPNTTYVPKDIHPMFKDIFEQSVEREKFLNMIHTNWMKNEYQRKDHNQKEQSMEYREYTNAAKTNKNTGSPPIIVTSPVIKTKNRYNIYIHPPVNNMEKMKNGISHHEITSTSGAGRLGISEKPGTLNDNYNRKQNINNEKAKQSHTESDSTTDKLNDARLKRDSIESSDIEGTEGNDNSKEHNRKVIEASTMYSYEYYTDYGDQITPATSGMGDIFSSADVPGTRELTDIKEKFFPKPTFFPIDHQVSLGGRKTKDNSNENSDSGRKVVSKNNYIHRDDKSTIPFQLQIEPDVVATMGKNTNDRTRESYEYVEKNTNENDTSIKYVFKESQTKNTKQGQKVKTESIERSSSKIYEELPNPIERISSKPSKLPMKDTETSESYYYEYVESTSQDEGTAMIQKHNDQQIKSSQKRLETRSSNERSYESYEYALESSLIEEEPSKEENIVKTKTAYDFQKIPKLLSEKENIDEKTQSYEYTSEYITDYVELTLPKDNKMKEVEKKLTANNCTPSYNQDNLRSYETYEYTLESSTVEDAKERTEMLKPMNLPREIPLQVKNVENTQKFFREDPHVYESTSEYEYENIPVLESNKVGKVDKRGGNCTPSYQNNKSYESYEYTFESATVENLEENKTEKTNSIGTVTPNFAVKTSPPKSNRIHERSSNEEIPTSEYTWEYTTEYDDIPLRKSGKAEELGAKLTSNGKGCSPPYIQNQDNYESYEYTLESSTVDETKRRLPTKYNRIHMRSSNEEIPTSEYTWKYTTEYDDTPLPKSDKVEEVGAKLASNGKGCSPPYIQNQDDYENYEYTLGSSTVDETKGRLPTKNNRIHERSSNEEIPTSEYTWEYTTEYDDIPLPKSDKVEELGAKLTSNGKGCSPPYIQNPDYNERNKYTLESSTVNETKGRLPTKNNRIHERSSNEEIPTSEYTWEYTTEYDDIPLPKSGKVEELGAKLTSNGKGCSPPYIQNPDYNERNKYTLESSTVNETKGRLPTKNNRIHERSSNEEIPTSEYTWEYTTEYDDISLPKSDKVEELGAKLTSNGKGCSPPYIQNQDNYERNKYALESRTVDETKGRLRTKNDRIHMRSSNEKMPTSEYTWEYTTEYDDIPLPKSGKLEELDAKLTSNGKGCSPPYIQNPDKYESYEYTLESSTVDETRENMAVKEEGTETTPILLQMNNRLKVRSSNEDIGQLVEKTTNVDYESYDFTSEATKEVFQNSLSSSTTKQQTSEMYDDFDLTETEAMQVLARLIYDAKQVKQAKTGTIKYKIITPETLTVPAIFPGTVQATALELPGDYKDAIAKKINSTCQISANKCLVEKEKSTEGVNGEVVTKKPFIAIIDRTENTNTNSGKNQNKNALDLMELIQRYKDYNQEESISEEYQSYSGNESYETESGYESESSPESKSEYNYSSSSYEYEKYESESSEGEETRNHINKKERRSSVERESQELRNRNKNLQTTTEEVLRRIPLDPHLETTLRSVYGQSNGRIVTATAIPPQQRDLVDGNLFFVGENIMLPLVVRQKDNGYVLTLDVSNLCKGFCGSKEDQKNPIKRACERFVGKYTSGYSESYDDDSYSSYSDSENAFNPVRRKRHDSHPHMKEAAHKIYGIIDHFVKVLKEAYDSKDEGKGNETVEKIKVLNEQNNVMNTEIGNESQSRINRLSRSLPGMENIMKLNRFVKKNIEQHPEKEDTEDVEKYEAEFNTEEMTKKFLEKSTEIIKVEEEIEETKIKTETQEMQNQQMPEPEQRNDNSSGTTEIPKLLQHPKQPKQTLEILIDDTKAITRREEPHIQNVVYEVNNFNDNFLSTNLYDDSHNQKKKNQVRPVFVSTGRLEGQEASKKSFENPQNRGVKPDLDGKHLPKIEIKDEERKQKQGKYRNLESYERNIEEYLMNVDNVRGKIGTKEEQTEKNTKEKKKALARTTEYEIPEYQDNFKPSIPASNSLIPIQAKQSNQRDYIHGKNLVSRPYRGYINNSNNNVDRSIPIIRDNPRLIHRDPYLRRQNIPERTSPQFHGVDKKNVNTNIPRQITEERFSPTYRDYVTAGRYFDIQGIRQKDNYGQNFGQRYNLETVRDQPVATQQYQRNVYQPTQKYHLEYLHQRQNEYPGYLQEEFQITKPQQQNLGQQDTNERMQVQQRWRDTYLNPMVSINGEAFIDGRNLDKNSALNKIDGTGIVPKVVEERMATRELPMQKTNINMEDEMLTPERYNLHQNCNSESIEHKQYPESQTKRKNIEEINRLKNELSVLLKKKAERDEKHRRENENETNNPNNVAKIINAMIQEPIAINYGPNPLHKEHKDEHKTNHHHHKRHHKGHHHVKEPTTTTPPSNQVRMSSVELENENCEKFLHKRLGLFRSLLNWARDWVTETAVRTKQAINTAKMAREFDE